MKKHSLVLLGLIVCMALPVLAERQGYYRFPAISGQTLIFTSEGDLWSVELPGGPARRLTSHPGMESNPAISPDGKMVAFTGQYEGPSEVYTMPLTGGLPQRRTFAGQNAVVAGWTPGGRVLYTTQRYSTLPNSQLAALDLKTNQEELLPLNQASEGSYDSEGRTLFFTRLPFQGSFTKRYKGGTAQNIWKYTAGAPEAIPLTADYPGTSKTPMWWKGRIYFVSDRDGTMNLWSMNEDGKNLKQHTFHKGLDVSAASLSGGKIAYQLVADLRILDLDKNKDQTLTVSLPSDFDQLRERWVDKPMDYLSSAHLSPSGDRVVLNSRGHLFVAPAGPGRLARITRKEGVRSRSGRFLPDGKSILYLTDESGEWEFYSSPANGLGQPEKLTGGATVIRFDGEPSPDGKWIAFGDKDLQLWLYSFEKKSLQKIGVSENGMFADLAWSPDSKWLAYAETANNLFGQIKLYQLETGTVTALTDDRVDSSNPAWSPDGKWLYFLSERYFQSVVGSPWGANQPEPYFEKTTRIFAADLSGKERFPFLPPDELAEASKPENKEKAVPGEEKKPDGKGKEPVVAAVIELAGLAQRIHEVPVPAGAYANLAVNGTCLFLVERPNNYSFRGKIVVWEIKNRDIKSKTLAEEVGGFELSLDGKKMLFQKQDGLYVIDANANPPAQPMEKRVDLAGWQFPFDPREEWRQMYTDAWRMERDYFYDRNLHGTDYQRLYQRYLPYLERVSDRLELSDLLGHLVGELSALHTFVRGGDIRRGTGNILAGSLGARLSRDEAAGGFRVDHIYRSDPNYPEKMSPLAQLSVNMKEGDIITAVNGTPAIEVPDLSLLLRNTAGRQVHLAVKPAGGGESRAVVVTPVSTSQDSDLRYEEWEYTRRLEVEKMSGGTIGYVHLRAMGGGNYTEWVKNYFPVFDRQGLIIDVRHNRGGNIDSWILEKLLRKAWFFWQGRVGRPTWNMQYAFRGHLVVLCNEYTASDGEAFAEGFRRLGLGQVIGTRTWGGEIWLSQNNRLVDQGIASAAETGVYGPEGAWLIEGHGVEPDIVVDNLPRAAFEGKDAQLEAAIRHLQEKIKQRPVKVPPPPPYPDKSK